MFSPERKKKKKLSDLTKQDLSKTLLTKTPPKKDECSLKEKKKLREKKNTK